MRRLDVGVALMRVVESTPESGCCTAPRSSHGGVLSAMESVLVASTHGVFAWFRPNDRFAAGMTGKRG